MRRSSILAAGLVCFFLAGQVRGGEFVALDDDPRDPRFVAPFSFTERSGKTITLDDLRGKIWVAHFFYGCCTQGCAQTTSGMMELQHAFAGNPEVVLVSFTLDPESDTPEQLRKFAADHQADSTQWLFLSGNEKDIHYLVETSFMRPASRSGDPDPGKKITHSFSLMLVDGTGRVRGYIRDGRDPEQIKLLQDHIRMLTGGALRAFLPAFNASLNAACAVLLVIGYAAIRRRFEVLHKGCMLAALAVSAVFLTSYLYYHFAVLHGQPGRFQGQGWVRPVYFSVLVSHTLLALVAAPLALFTAYQGLRDRRPRHIRVARWTLPIWLYVSITGVAVYAMLYHPPESWLK